jgi:Uncharacterised nucleotidyltransferase
VNVLAQKGKAATDVFADTPVARTSARNHLPFPLEAVPALELLLCCARRQLDAGLSARVGELLEQRVDWDVLLSLANAHGLSPLLYWNLWRNFSQLLPPAVGKAIQDSFQSNAQRNLLLVLELVDILRLLASKNISVVPFKGPTLAEALYGNIALRQCSDLDLFIRPDDLAAGIKTLVSEGYIPGLQLSPPQQTAWVRSHYEYGLVSPGGSLIEFQWAIVPRYFSLPFGTEQLWQGLRTIRIGGVDVLALSPENLLLVLCIHGGKHQWNRLVWLSDIAEILQLHADLDWDYVVRQARVHRAERMLLLGLSLTHIVFGTALPENIRVRLTEDKAVVSLNRQVCRALIRGSELSELAAHVFLIRTRERWIDKIRYILRFILTPTSVEWSLVRLPKIFFPLYSALRVTRGFLKTGTLARRWARKRSGSVDSRAEDL